jgi:hypothetical protein
MNEVFAESIHGDRARPELGPLQPVLARTINALDPAARLSLAASARSSTMGTDCNSMIWVGEASSRSGTIYRSFKKMVGEIDGIEACESVILDISKWAAVYQMLRVGEHPDIDRNHLEYLRSSFSTYATILMDIVDKHSRIDGDRICVEDKRGLNAALTQLVVYDVCRFLGGFPSKEITRFVPTIPKKLEGRDSEFANHYASAFKELVTSTPEGYRQPRLSVLRRSVVELDLYNRKRKPLKKFLMLLENIRSRELLSFERDLIGCEIEHVMPQTLTREWGHITAAVHERFVHTLGNLAITFYNEGLGNRSFEEKKRILENHSRIKLNRILSKYEKFDESAIRDRALTLLDMFARAYGISDNPDESDEWQRVQPGQEPAGEIRVSFRLRNLCANAVIRGGSLLVLKGSQARLDDRPSLSESEARLKRDLVKRGVLAQDGDVLVFVADYLFPSPSLAATIVAGSPTNGRRAWKSEHGSSLQDLVG